MVKRKTLQELTIKDNFMFGAVMADEENCRRLLEMVLGFPIGHVEIIREKSFVYHSEQKGVRLDVYAKDENNTRYNVEMQVVRKPGLEKRVRYYHGQIDMELLLSGQDYTELPGIYVIFICDFDPFGQGKYCYTFEKRCLEDVQLSLGEGSRSIFLNTNGNNKGEVSDALAAFLRFVKADLAESQMEFEDEFVKRLQGFICHVKESRRMEEKYMVFEEMLRDERTEGKAEGKAEAVMELLEELGAVPQELCSRIMAETDLVLLKRWHKLAARADSIGQFIREMQ